ncbi:MAG: tRNA (adenosine(37)-N6)-threonylcarbamoyltransferase complex ATPase subunit type 1 TsaE [Actinobacteria bacterium]|nr:tRNA (adenosine(37)-N6)-threonylcarbamoyltransferase complex ATPase subunit type 1 TsaE [Actinomycetota bacterium]
MRVVPTSDVLEVATDSVEGTRALARAIAAVVEAGDVFVLGGELGAGKTAFTQGLGAALGVTGRIVSPTFTIERIHQGRFRLHHLDVYRLDRIHEALDLDLDEALDDGDVAVIEWGESIAGVLGRDHLFVGIGLGAGDDDRTITLAVHGPSWERRLAGLARIVDAVGPRQVDSTC